MQLDMRREAPLSLRARCSLGIMALGFEEPPAVQSREIRWVWFNVLMLRETLGIFRFSLTPSATRKRVGLAIETGLTRPILPLIAVLDDNILHFSRTCERHALRSLLKNEHTEFKSKG